MMLKMLKSLGGGLSNVSGVSSTSSRTLSQDIQKGYEVYHGAAIHKVLEVEKRGNTVYCYTKRGTIAFPFGTTVICYK